MTLHIPAGVSWYTLSFVQEQKTRHCGLEIAQEYKSLCIIQKGVKLDNHSYILKIEEVESPSL